ncbi:hypothetical protein [Streptomyces sp. SAJ15]|uniref:hypothetical protein n=1 Tax=Streptomyces sp. SAJ15 TaxID=2011095 RepID=UPI00118494C1|nr:hypothetical protein [Streptomyces sp. SAJ15]TVL89793.1 hypothetical protein CD790_25695 [Streptomyces sp. SAJ15]
MDTTTAATEAQVTASTIRTWCRRGAVAATKISGRWVVDAASLAHRIAIGARRIALKAKKVVLTIENMVAIGGRRWQKNGKDRVYFNAISQYLGLEIESYKSGNIRWAALDGEQISNAEAVRLLGSIYKVYFDAADGELYIQWDIRTARSLPRDEIASRIRNGIRTAVAAL